MHSLVETHNSWGTCKIKFIYFQIERDNLKKLVEEGRFEILTGGWVMTDEANVHIFAMVDQLIEGKIGIWSSYDKKGSRSGAALVNGPF